MSQKWSLTKIRNKYLRIIVRIMLYSTKENALKGRNVFPKTLEMVSKP